MEIKNILREAGIVGAGGAGFPSYAKLSDGADTLLINAAECEPLLFTDFTILGEELDTVLDGARLIADALGIKRVLLCMKDHNAQTFGFSDGEELPHGVNVRVLPDVYPLGDEINLIYESTGRLVQPGCLPITQGVIVYNVETLYNVSLAVRDGKGVTDKWLTLGGDLEETRVLRVPVGTPFKKLFKKYGITVPESHVVVDGGPSMGRIVNPMTAVVGKTTKGILILPRDIPAISMKLRSADRHVAVANAVCCQCTNCTEMCPRALLGYPLEPHRLVRASNEVVRAMPEAFTSALLCCGCGICEISACGQYISPKAVIAEQKKLLAEARIRYPQGKEPVAPTSDRAMRRVPVSRWRSLLGVAKYHRAPQGDFEEFSCDEVLIPLNRHIGAPSVAAVKVGDRVAKGDLVALAADGLSIHQHASIDGVVTAIDENGIRIKKK